MKTTTLPTEYANSLIFELEKAFWDERGKGARFRMTKVGLAYYEDKIRPRLTSAEIEEIVPVVADVLQTEGIAADVSHSREERLLKISVKGCLHLPVEERMVAKGVEPFTCVPANLIALAIEEKLDLPVELAEIKVDQGRCQLLLVVFEKRPTLA